MIEILTVVITIYIYITNIMFIIYIYICINVALDVVGARRDVLLATLHGVARPNIIYIFIYIYIYI